MTRDNVLQAVLVAVSAGLVGAGFAALINSGFKSDDVFAFAGALIGAAATVSGAVWLTDRTSRLERKAERDIIVDQLAQLRASAQQAEASYDFNDDGFTSEFITALHKTVELCKQVDAILKESAVYSKTFNFIQRARIAVSHIAIKSFISFYYDSFGPYDDDPQDERDWPTTLDYLSVTSEDALAAFGSTGGMVEKPTIDMLKAG